MIRPDEDRGGCVRLALYQAGIRAFNLPDWVHIDDLPAVCDQMGLIWLGAGSVVEDYQITRAIVIYPIERDGSWTGHAEYVDNLMSEIDRFEEINGVIVLPEARRLMNCARFLS